MTFAQYIAMRVFSLKITATKEATKSNETLRSPNNGLIRYDLQASEDFYVVKEVLTRQVKILR